MLLVIDTSVVVKWLFLETLNDQATAVRQDWVTWSLNLRHSRSSGQ